MVTPRKPNELKKARARGLLEDMEEYDRLLSERYAEDPSLQGSAADKRASSDRERRINVLGKRLAALKGKRAKRK